jgi:hypothetical protein
MATQLGIMGLKNRFVHKIGRDNQLPESGFDDQANTIRLVEGRANEISVPITVIDGIASREMAWNDVGPVFDSTPGTATQISEFCKQVNLRYKGSSTLDPTVIERCETIDAETGNRYVFTPGATPVGSLQDFDVIIPDQEGGYESRGFVIFLSEDANSNGLIDDGNVLIRLNNTGVAETWS